MMIDAAGKRLKLATQRLIERIGGLAEADKNSRPDFRRFSDYQSFSKPDRFIPADAIADLERAVGDPVVTRELAEVAGFDLVRRVIGLRDAGVDPAPCLRRLTAELGDVARCEDNALAHVRASANDTREEVAALLNLIDLARSMIDAVERGVKRGTELPRPPLREARSAS